MKLSKSIGILLFIAILATGLVVILFIASENIIHKRNNFVRRFSDGVEKTAQLDLKSNGYYFAGESADTLYLGSYDGPLYLTKVNKNLTAQSVHHIQLSHMNLPFRSAEVRVQPPYFFLTDGTVPCIFRGKLHNLFAKYIAKPGGTFSRPVVIDSATIAYRTHDQTGQSVIGIQHIKGAEKLSNRLLQKQIDGNFDVDGTLNYDTKLQKLVYTYLYRNQYVIAQNDLSLAARGNTIDTTSKAQIKVAYVKSIQAQKMAAPPLVVNQTATTGEGLLYVHSKLIGKYEDAKIWNQASVIDVYNLKDQTYIASLYIYHINKKAPRSLFATGNHLYAIIGQTLVRYQLTSLITSHQTK